MIFLGGDLSVDVISGKIKRWHLIFGSHQISVDEAVSLQVFHSLAHILTHGQEPRIPQSPAHLSQEVQQTAIRHEFNHNQQGALLQTHAIQLHQLRVTHPPRRRSKRMTSPAGNKHNFLSDMSVCAWLSALPTSWLWPPRWSPPPTWPPPWWSWWPPSAPSSTCRASPGQTGRCRAPSWRRAHWGWSPTSLQKEQVKTGDKDTRTRSL